MQYTAVIKVFALLFVLLESTNAFFIYCQEDLPLCKFMYSKGEWFANLSNLKQVKNYHIVETCIKIPHSRMHVNNTFQWFNTQQKQSHPPLLFTLKISFYHNT